MQSISGWDTVIGLEVHVQLATKTKIFSGASTAFGAEPNTQACAIDLAMPGTLPVLNKQAVHYAVMFGLAVDAEIGKESAFERKNYFYPDLPKGYQTTQDKEPICKGGFLKIKTPSGKIKETFGIAGGYYDLKIVQNGKHHKIHRLVALHFIENPHNKPYVNHINGIKFDNRVENLEWVTNTRNRQHMHEVYGRPVFDTILRNDKLLRVGKRVYEITQDINDVADIWNCDTANAAEILDKIGVKRKRYKQKLPNIQREQIKQDIKDMIIYNQKNGIKMLFNTKFREFLDTKYNTKFNLRFYVLLHINKLA